MRSHTSILISLSAMLAVVLSGCGGGGTRLPPPALSITTASLPDWMATFAYTQTVHVLTCGWDFEYYRDFSPVH
jgi:hypothetical protein